MRLPGLCWTFPWTCPHCGSDQAAGFALQLPITYKITEDKKNKKKIEKHQQSDTQVCCCRRIYIFFTGCPTLVVFIERSIYSVHVEKRLLNAVCILKPSLLAGLTSNALIWERFRIYGKTLFR